MNKNYCKVLGISPQATEQEIKKAYFAKAKMYHPDVCKDKDAEEKFKEVSAAYETLKNPETRRQYDEHIKSNPNSTRSDYNDTSKNYGRDYSVLHTMFSSNQTDDKYFFETINNNFKTESDVANAYSYFWLSFWSGGKGTIDMLKHKNAGNIFKAFCSNYFIKRMKESLIKEIEENPSQKAKVQGLKMSLEKMYNNIPAENSNSQAVFNWMIKLINEDNIFDDESTMYYFLLVSSDVFKVLTKFEQIFDANSAIKAKSHYSNITKVKRGGGILSSVLIILAIVFIFRLFF